MTMNPIFKIWTPRFEYYNIYSNGEIQRLDIPGFMPTNYWVMLGIDHVKRNEFYPLSMISRELIDSLDMTYKNGNPQYTVRDRDHGTLRTWGCGVAGFSFCTPTPTPFEHSLAMSGLQ